MEYKYNCKITGYELTYVIHDRSAILSNIESDYKYINALTSLFKRSYISLKEKGISDMYMSITTSEKDILKTTTWHIIGESDDSLLLRCKIDEYIENWAKCSGILR